MSNDVREKTQMATPLVAADWLRDEDGEWCALLVADHDNRFETVLLDGEPEGWWIEENFDEADIPYPRIHRDAGDEDRDVYARYGAYNTYEYAYIDEVAE